MVFQSTMIGTKERKTLILPPAFGHCHLLLQLRLPKFCTCFLFLEIRQSCCCWYSFRTKLLEAKTLQACSLLIVATSNFGLSGHHLASLLLATNHDPLGCGLHVHCHFPFPPSWLQLLTTIIVVMILILVVVVLHLLCLQLFTTFLVVVLMLIVVFLVLLLGCSC